MNHSDVQTTKVMPGPNLVTRLPVTFGSKIDNKTQWLIPNELGYLLVLLTTTQSWLWGSLSIVNLNNFVWIIESDWNLLTFKLAAITTKGYKLLLKISCWFIVLLLLLLLFFCVIPVHKQHCQIVSFQKCS